MHSFMAANDLIQAKLSLLGKSISGIYLIHPICALMAVMLKKVY